MTTERPALDRSISSDIFVRYHSGMSGVVDRAEWRAFLLELLEELGYRKKAPLARLLGVAEKTIDRWLDPEWEGAVSEASVRQVAEKTGRNALQLLIRFGYYDPNDLPAPATPPEDAWIIEVINSSGRLDDATKARMIAVQLAAAKREREERLRQIEEQIEIVSATAEPRGPVPPQKRGKK